MKKNFKNVSLLSAIIFFSVITMIASVLSILNVTNVYIRVITQASLSITMFLNGMYHIKYKEQKKLGYALLCVATLLLVVMIYTVSIYLV